MTDKEVLKLALEALEAAGINENCVYEETEIIRKALAQPERTWVGLTELEKAEITSLKWWDWEDTFDIEGFIRAIEAKLKEKNT